MKYHPTPSSIQTLITLTLALTLTPHTTTAQNQVPATAQCTPASTTQEKCFFQPANPTADTFANAGAQCSAFITGATLASIISQAEQSTVESYVNAQATAIPDRYWIGFNDKQTETVFIWTDASTPSYANWGAGLAATDNYWIGLNDIVLETVFEWVDYSPLTFTNWDAPTYPRTRDANDCIFSSLTLNHKWRDKTCTQTAFGLCSRIETITPPVPDPFEYCIEIAPYTTKCYFWSNTQDTVAWQTASATCMQEGASLASIFTQQEQNAVNTFLNHTNTTFNVWIGYNKIPDGSTFEWSDTTQPHIPFTNWDVNYPITTEYVDCTSVNGVHLVTGKWTNIVCSTNLYPLCSRVINEPRGYKYCFTNEKPDHTPAYSRCYYWLPGPYTWQDAQDACNSTGGSLATISYPSDHYHLYQYTLNNSIVKPFWIGLYNIGKLPYWVWNDDTPHVFSVWAENNPSLDPNQTKRCAFADANSNFKWKNENCLSHLLPAVCSTYETTQKPQRSSINGVAVVAYGEGYTKLLFQILYQIAVVGQQDADNFFNH